MKVKEGSCEEPKLKASIKSESLNIGYLRKKNQHLQTNTDSQSRIIQVEPSAKFHVGSVTHTKQVGQGRDSWVKLGPWWTNQSGAESQSLHYFSVDFNASGVPDSTKVTASLTFSATAQDYYQDAESDGKAVATNFTLQAHVYEHFYLYAYL